MRETHFFFPRKRKIHNGQFLELKVDSPEDPKKLVNFCEVNNLSRTKKIVFSNGAQKQKTLAGAGTLFRGGHLSPAQNVAIQCVCPPEGHQKENPLEKYGKISDLIPALLFSRRGDPSARCVYVFAIDDDVFVAAVKKEESDSRQIARIKTNSFNQK